MKDRHRLREARDRFAALLENPKSLEWEWQKLFEEFPFILTDALSLNIDPDQLIPCRPGQPKADFYFYPITEVPRSPYGVIELKRPSTNILKVPRKDVLCLSSDATTAIAQARKYAMDIKTEIAGWPSSSLVVGNRLHIIIIAGLSKEFAEKITTEILKSQVAGLLPPGCKLVPYDTLSQWLASQVPPCLHVTIPYELIKFYKGEGGFFRVFGPREMYPALCSECGQPVSIPIAPAFNRPVFCKDCNRKRKRF
jgi:CxxC-x17-CxxC domain-containing protein